MNPKQETLNQGLLQYIVGWRAGAAGGVCTEDRDVHFKRGFDVGRIARSQAYAAACAEYGYRLNVMRLQGEEEASP